MHRHYQTIGSTNDAAKTWARGENQDKSTCAPHGAVVSADEQTRGRGRRGRSWVSSRDKGIYLSMIWRPKMSAHQIGRLTIITALAAARALETATMLNIQTKWPNDLLVNRKKVGGILCEAEFKTGAAIEDSIEFVVAGVGLNINFGSEEFPHRPVFPATSLQIETGKSWSIEPLRAACIQTLRDEYSRYATGEWQNQRAEFIARCITIGEVITVKNEAQPYSGVATNINEDGVLVVQTETGIRPVLAGEVEFQS